MREAAKTSGRRLPVISIHLKRHFFYRRYPAFLQTNGDETPWENIPVQHTGEAADGRAHEAPFTRAEANGNNVRYYRADGSGIERRGGTRSWRNNNPGNIRGARNEIGTAGGFAIFADYETGFTAIIDLLRSNEYNNLTINAAIVEYAPPIENDTENYQKFISSINKIR